MAAPAVLRGSGEDEVGELSASLRAEIQEQVGGRTVYFSGRKDFGDAGAVFLAEKLRGNTVVERLWLTGCGIGAVGARALAEVLGEDNIALNYLNLSANYLDDDGAEAMALVLRKNTTLEFLDLGCCGVGDRGVRALGEALKENSTLKTIYLSDHDFGDDGANELAEALRWNESLKVIDLKECLLTDAGASSILASVRESNSALTDLDFAFNEAFANDEMMDAIEEMLEENKAVIPETAERRARCLLFCCLQLAPTAHEHVVPSIGAVPVPVMQYAVEHAGKLHVAKRFEHGNIVAGHSAGGVRARSSSSLSSSDSLDNLEPATARRR